MQMNQERVDELVPRKETVVKQKLIDKIKKGDGQNGSVSDPDKIISFKSL